MYYTRGSIPLLSIELRIVLLNFILVKPRILCIPNVSAIRFQAKRNYVEKNVKTYRKSSGKIELKKLSVIDKNTTYKIGLNI